MKKTNTKRALGMSLISLLACGIMFAGSTYAWFTDSVEVKGNKIETGTLKVDLEILEGTSWKSLRGSEDPVFGNVLWEPGYTDFAVFKIENEGNLAVKWNLSAVKVGADAKGLANVIDVYVLESDAVLGAPKSIKEADYEKIGTLADVLAKGTLLEGKFDANKTGAAKYLGIMLHMQEEAGNQYQGADDVAFDLKLNAYQLNQEVDGFGSSDYDKVEYISLDSSSNIAEALKGLSGKAVVSVEGAIDARSNTGLAGLDVTFVGASEDASIDFGAANVNASGSNVKFENITVKSSNDNYKGLQHSASETYVNCQIEGKRFLYGENVAFENCTFVQNTNDYSIWTYGAKNVSFENCEFFNAGKAILVYNEGKNITTNVTVANSTFNSTAKGYTSTGDWCAAIEIDSSLSVNGHYTVTAKNNKVSDNYDGVARVKKHSNNNYTLNETGTTILTGTAAAVAGEQNVDTLLGDTLTGEATVQVLTGGNMVWTTGAAHGSTPFGAASIESLTITGAGAENSTLTFVGSGVGPVRANGNGVLTVKDVTVIDETVSYKEDAWEFTYLEIGEANSEVVFENVVFESGISVDSRKATFINCTFKSPRDSEYSVWVSNGTASFEGCTFVGTRGLKMHEAYGTEIAKVTVNNCTFDSLTKKPGIAIGTLNADTTVEILNSKFINCQAGDQNLYMYESDTDLSTITFVNTNNTVTNN